MNRTEVPIYSFLIAWAVLLGVSIPTLTQGQTIVPSGAVWHYLDDGSDQGTAWRAPGFNDSAWATGASELGYGDGGEATTLSRTNAAGGTNITFYFRHTFTAPDLSTISNLLVRIRRDDGAIVYLNDVEIFRSNMPQGPVTASTLALTTASDDGSTFFANAVGLSRLVPGQNVIAAEVHQRATSSTDVSFDLELVSNVEFQPPSVSIASPTNGAVVGSLNVEMTAAATDVDGTISLVEYFVGNTLIEGAMTPPFTATWSNVTAGTYTLRAVAVDSTGLSSTSAPVTVTVPVRLVPSGASWRYLDSGVVGDPGWMLPGFNDAGWPSGFAPLGFGEGNEATVLSRTNAVGDTNVTYYFRHEFNVGDLASISDLVLRVQRDDGCVIYLNGAEVFRDNLPAGAISSNTLATAAIDDARYHSARLPVSSLVGGRNVIAAEVHQATQTSSDIRFNLELLPNRPPASPVIAITAPTNGSRFLNPGAFTVTTSASDYDDRITSVGFLLNGVNVGTDTSDPFSLSLSNITAGTYTLTAVARDVFGNQSTSAPVGFRVFLPPVSVSLIETGSVWKYFDTGVDLGTAWREPGFDDSGWLSGPGKLGFADNPVTPINIGPVGSRFLTTYFRREFMVVDAVEVTNLAFRVLRDDGCVVYVNGEELFRMNMPSGPISFTNRATTAVGGTNENHYYPIAIVPPFGALRDGANILAVELHQSDPTSSDAGFDLGVTAVSPAPGTSSRMSISPTSSGVEISWRGAGVLQSAPEVGGPFLDIDPPVTASPYRVPAAPERRFFRVRVE